MYWRRGLRWWTLGVGAVVAGAIALSALRPMLVPFGLALAIAYLLAPAVAALERRGMRRDWAILTVYTGMACVAVVIVLRVLPSAYWELRRLAAQLPDYAEIAWRWTGRLQERLRTDGIPSGLSEGVNALFARLESQMEQVLAGAVANLLVFLRWGFYLVLAPILAYYLLRDLHQVRAGFARTLPRRWRQPALELVHGIDQVLAGFVRGQLLLALMIGALASAAAYLLGLRFSLLLGLWAGAAELVPYIGPVIGAVPAVLAGLAISPVRGLQVALAFAMIQQLENAVLGPRVMGDAVGLHPLAVLTAVVVGGYLAGVPGLILAVPAVGIVRVVWLFAVRRLVTPRLVGAAAEGAPAARNRGPV